ncbi:MAG: phosphotransferase family protein [Promethearchaeota archaeon]
MDESGVPPEVRIGPYTYGVGLFADLLGRGGVSTGGEGLSGVKGPFDGKINSMYRVDFPRAGPFLFRFRVSGAFRYEPMVKEKVLYPLLDGSLDPFAPDVHEEVRRLARQRTGSYHFTGDRAPVVPVQEILYWDETREVVPHDYTIKEFIPGNSLYELLDRGFLGGGAEHPALLELFRELGRMLGRLHAIEFDGFYEKITEIGDPRKRIPWPTLFGRMLDKELNDARRNKSIVPLLPAIERYFKDASGEIREDEVPVVFHNDFQAQNFIVSPPKEGGRLDDLKIAALIDFDNWRVGTRAQDFVKILYWTIQGRRALEGAFFGGYGELHRVDAGFLKQIESLELLWLMLVYNFEEDKLRRAEQNATVDARFPASGTYLREIERIVRAFL